MAFHQVFQYTQLVAQHAQFPARVEAMPGIQKGCQPSLGVVLLVEQLADGKVEVMGRIQTSDGRRHCSVAGRKTLFTLHALWLLTRIGSSACGHEATMVFRGIIDFGDGRGRCVIPCGAAPIRGRDRFFGRCKWEK